MPTIKITVQSELVSPLSSSLRLDLPDDVDGGDDDDINALTSPSSSRA